MRWRKDLKLKRTSKIPLIDIFAGPGGLGEGFSAYNTENSDAPFRIALSIEKDQTAHRTLRLRSFFRKFSKGDAPDAYYQYVRGEIPLADLRLQFADQWAAAEIEAWHAELGSRQFPPNVVDARIRDALSGTDRPWLLIGGPPCQAYSLVGRSKNCGLKGYRASDDKRHVLYKAYLRIVARHWPTIFVMENVKGLLSSRIGSRRIFDEVCTDLKAPARVFPTKDGPQFTYALHAVVATKEGLNSHPADFVVRCEELGIPQSRHRVIIVGVRSDVVGRPATLVESEEEPAPIEAVIKGLPMLRSGLSRLVDSPGEWVNQIKASLKEDWTKSHIDLAIQKTLVLYRRVAKEIGSPSRDRGKAFIRTNRMRIDSKFCDWFLDPRVGGVLLHDTRSHMTSDLHRYLYAACFAQVHGRSPSLIDFPEKLHPVHKNVKQSLNGSNFADRFRVQVWGRPATTITSHIVLPPINQAAFKRVSEPPACWFSKALGVMYPSAECKYVRLNRGIH